MSVLLSSGSPAAAPPSTSVSLSECPTLSPKPASVETTDGRHFLLSSCYKIGKMKSKRTGGNKTTEEGKK